MSAVDLEHCPKLAPSARLQTDPLTGESVVLYPEGVLVLNSTAGAILTLADGTTSLNAIIQSLAGEYDVPRQDLQADVLECFCALRQRQLIVFASGERGENPPELPRH